MHEAHHDALTGLLNRRQFLESLDNVGSGPIGCDDHTALLFVDIDNFKTINDTCGHDAGDAVLISVARHLTTMVRPGDIVARFGGDEFTVLLRDLEHEDVALEVAERVTHGLAAHHVLNGHAIAISVSVGVATSKSTAVTGSGLLRLADEAMYASKRAGRARWTRSDPGSVVKHSA